MDKKGFDVMLSMLAIGIKTSDQLPILRRENWAVAVRNRRQRMQSETHTGSSAGKWKNLRILQRVNTADIRLF